LVVGLGEVGSALAQVLRRGGRVLEHDLERREFDEPIGVMHLCFPFTRQADFEELALSYIGRFKPELTIINSTVIPGTSRAIAERSSAPIAYSPVRGKHVCMAQDLLKYRKFVAGSDDIAANRAAAHFRAAGMNTQCISRTGETRGNHILRRTHCLCPGAQSVRGSDRRRLCRSVGIL
jgi:hypothetical protein